MFGNPIELTVTFTELPPLEPSLSVLSPLVPGGGGDGASGPQGPDVCLAAGFRPQAGEMVVNVQNSSTTLNTGGAVLSKTEKTYFSGLVNTNIFSCQLHGTVANNDNIESCDHHPEEAKLNFYLLMMNGIRVVFTKTLAFNTILTIRALLLSPHYGGL